MWLNATHFGNMLTTVVTNCMSIRLSTVCKSATNYVYMDFDEWTIDFSDLRGNVWYGMWCVVLEQSSVSSSSTVQHSKKELLYRWSFRTLKWDSVVSVPVVATSVAFIVWFLFTDLFQIFSFTPLIFQ